MPDRSTLKLGRKPADRLKPHLTVRDFVRAVPPTPIVDEAPDLDYPMDLNNRYGDCVVAALDHALQVISWRFGVPRVNWTSDQIIAYYKTQNPNFPLQDDGMYVQDFLSYLTKQGVILGFAAFNPDAEEDVKAATYLFLAPVIGVNLQVAQQSQDIWDYVPRSGEWGGHAIPWVGYTGTPDDMTCVTWGALVDMTETFVRELVDEAWVVITREHVEHPAFREGFDLAAFAAAYKSITGRDFPVDVDPPSPPPLPPEPVPWWQQIIGCGEKALAAARQWFQDNL